MSITLKKSVTGLAVLCATVALTSCAAAGLESEAGLVERARGVHERVITLDTHNDINAANFTAEQNYTMDLGNQVNLPKTGGRGARRVVDDRLRGAR